MERSVILNAPHPEFLDCAADLANALTDGLVDGKALQAAINARDSWNRDASIIDEDNQYSISELITALQSLLK